MDENLQRYNVIGDELRQLNERFATIEAAEQLIMQKLDGLEAQGPANCQRFDGMEARFNQIVERQGLMEAAANARAAEMRQMFGEAHRDYLDATARLDVIEGLLTQEWSKAIQKRARKRQPKPVRRKKGRK